LLKWIENGDTLFVPAQSECLPNIRQRLYQEDEEPNSEPELLTLVIDQPKACELYYACYVMVDRYNRCRQADL